MNSANSILPFAHKIRPRQRDRLAIVYVRQSSAQQVVSNRESADLQYQLRQRAILLGWSDARILVIDDDQGISGASVENRPLPLGWVSHNHYAFSRVEDGNQLRVAGEEKVKKCLENVPQ
jgi:hypothetical protein